MELSLIFVLLMFGLGLIVVGASNLVFVRIVHDVNRASPEHEQISLWKAGFSSYRILRRHRALFPESRKRSKMGWLSALGSVLWLGALIFGILVTHAGWTRN